MYFSRRRSPGNGYKSSSMGMGTSAAVSRISPDSTPRGHGFYNSEYRNFNRGFGRGRSKPYQSPQPPPKGEVFMVAGRLAAEYLISKGLLPPNLLPPKWQNSVLKKYVGNFQEFRPQEAEEMVLHSEGRSSAISRLGNFDAGPSRKRFPGDYTVDISPNTIVGKRKTGSVQNHSSDWGLEIGRGGSRSEKAIPSPDKEADDAVSRQLKEQQGSENIDGDMQNVNLTEIVPSVDGADISESEVEKHQFMDDIGSNASCSASKEDCTSDSIGEINKEPDDLRSSGIRDGENDDDIANEETRKESVTQDLHVDAVAGDPICKNESDLLRLCNFAKVPTRTRSSLTSRGLKFEPLPSDEEGYHSDNGEGVSIDDHNIDESLCNSLSNQAHSVACNISDSSRAESVHSAKDVGPLDLSYSTEQGNCMRSQSFPSKLFVHEQELLDQGQRGIARCSSMENMVKDRGEKRVLQQVDRGEGSKKPREWLPTMIAQAEEYSHLSNLSKGQSSSQKERASPGEKVIMLDQESSVNIPSFQKAEVELCIGYAEEKQLLPSSFKICDLNLMEASDMNENHNSSPILFYPSISETKKEVALNDIGSLACNNSNMPREYATHVTRCKEVEVIDLENDSTEEDTPFKNSENRTETVYTSLESFPNHAPSTSDMPDAQDGYGLMISELLGNDIPNCSSVPGDITLHNEIGLHNGEGILSDDDPIYMSLEEIPISFLRTWEQPSQEYQKPF